MCGERAGGRRCVFGGFPTGRKRSLLGQKLSGAKKDEEVELDMHADFAELEDLAQALGIDAVALESRGAQWSFKIEGSWRGASRIQCRDLFDKVHKGVTEEVEFRGKVLEQLESPSKAMRSVFQGVRDRIPFEKENIPLPDAFLKKWMISAHQGAEPMSDEQVEREYPAMAKGIRCNLETCVRTRRDESEGNGLQEAARAQVREQMAAYGQQMMDPALVDSIARIL